MAFGTPTDGGAAYSASGGTSVAPAYPSGITSNDALVLIVGMKPSTANGGTLTTPSGWTLRETLTGAGGYGTTLGADTGNTNLWILTKDTVNGTETGNLTVTVGTNNVAWGLIVRVPANGGTFSYGTADGSRTTAPTSGTAFTTTLTNGASAPNFEADDIAIWAMCIPTDVLNNGFTAPTISSTGATFGTPVELEEPDSGNGNDIGGYVAYAQCTSGSSTAAPTVGVTATGTVTNVRGPIALLRIRETLPERTGSLSATEGDVDTFSATGDVIVEGSLAVSETGTDTFSASGTVQEMASTGSLAATETGNDTFSSSGDVIVSGSLSVSETGNDTFSSSGKVIVQGALSVSETGTDSFTSTGTATNTTSGTLDATEGADTFSSLGTVLVEGTADAVESASDTFTGTGVTTEIRSGAMAATEAADFLGSYATDGYVTDGYTINGWQGFVYYEIPLPSTVLEGVRYGPNGAYVGTATGGGAGSTYIDVNTGKIVRILTSTAAVII